VLAGNVVATVVAGVAAVVSEAVVADVVFAANVIVVAVFVALERALFVAASAIVGATVVARSKTKNL